jgi:CYTH domain-containing protein
MAREIERRFLVRDVRILDGRQGEPIIQGYLAKEPGSMSTRVRIRGERAFLTLKSPKQGFSRDEFEYAIPLADARQMLVQHCAGRVVRKTRYLVDHARHVFEVDVFQDRHAGLVLAEVELPHEQTPLCLPPWIGEEITHDSRYGNFTLAEQSALLGSSPLPPPALPASARATSVLTTSH